jgi:hypothetical protein
VRTAARKYLNNAIDFFPVPEICKSLSTFCMPNFFVNHSVITKHTHQLKWTGFNACAIGRDLKNVIEWKKNCNGQKQEQKDKQKGMKERERERNHFKAMVGWFGWLGGPFIFRLSITSPPIPWWAVLAYKFMQNWTNSKIGKRNCYKNHFSCPPTYLVRLL